MPCYPQPIWSKARRLFRDERIASIVITLSIIISGILLSLAFQAEIVEFGKYLLKTTGQGTIDLILFLLTAVSSTLLMLPIWLYAVAAVALGYNAFRVSIVMALGSATGSLTTMLVGRKITHFGWVQRRFPTVNDHPWTKGRSRLAITLMLFLGTASPLPCDVFYLACGVKRYPVVLFYVTMVCARTVRYLYLCYGIDLILNLP